MRVTYARAAQHGLQAAEYAVPSETFGAVRFVMIAGNELQLPLVPEDSSMLPRRPPNGQQARESDADEYACRLLSPGARS